MRNRTMQNTKNTTMHFFIRRNGSAWAILDIDGEVLDSGFESEAAAANFVVRFCQDHRMLYAIYY